MTDIQPEVITDTGLSMKVCVPEEWTDEQVVEFGESQSGIETECGWKIQYKDTDQERIACQDRPGTCHIVLSFLS